MELAFRHIGPDEVEREITQRDQFDSDDVGLIEALVREAHQNSLDAWDEGAGGMVRTRMAIHEPKGEEITFLKDLLRELPSHLDSCDLPPIDRAWEGPRILVIEDFGTKGLQGAWDRRDARPFSDFWRRVGKSHKTGQQGGRWGLGKLVFSSASGARSFFGLTVRNDDHAGEALLMGQAVLAVHEDNAGRELDAHGFFCELGPKGVQLPVRDPAFIRQFSEATGISRTSEPGLSVVVPFIRSDLGLEALIRELLRNYYFPILTRKLASTVGDIVVDADSFDSLAATHGGPLLQDGRIIGLIRALRTSLDSGGPSLVLPQAALQNLEKAVTADQLAELRRKFSAGELVHVRAPLSFKHRVRGPLSSHIDLFLHATDGDSHGLVVRGAITLPREAREFQLPHALGALIAEDGVVSEFLGDAENPAHTGWNGNAEKLKANWHAAGHRLREIRRALTELGELVVQAVERDQPDALIDVLSVPAPAGSATREPKPVPKPKPVPDIRPRRRGFTIEPRVGGFTIRGATGFPEAGLPLRVTVSAAYNIGRGDPFKRYDPLDFAFSAGDIKVEASGATYTIEAGNRVVISATEADFHVAASGFDVNRDLVVAARASK